VRTWLHDELAADLMDWRHLAGEIAIEKLVVYAPTVREGGQLDVAAMRMSWTRPQLTGFELKISRADFLRDLRAGKWRRYLPCVERLFFAVPRGLVDRREVPPECGLAVRGPRSWSVWRAAPSRPVDPSARATFLQALLFRHYPAMWRPQDTGRLVLPGGLVRFAADLAEQP
jgi:hypothetical protein